MVFNATIGALVSSVGINLVESLQERVNSTTDILFSPLSIFAALFMLLFGTTERSQSRQELLHFFGSPSTNSDSLPYLADVFYDFFQPLIGDHKDTKTVKNHTATFLLANSLWGQSFKQSYMDLAKSKFFASVFPQPPTAAKVNTWVAKNTKNHITTILPPGFTMDPQSLLLVNTVFFHGRWKNEFKASQTREEDFQTLEGDPIKAKMMNTFKAKWDYDENEKYQVLDMPYTDDQFVATVVLPREVQSFANFTYSLDEKDWSTILHGKRHKQRVNLSLPKFDLEQEFKLKQVLGEAGVEEIFGRKAKLSNLSQIPIYVSDVKHKCRIEIDEKGSKASASTAVIMVRSAPAMVNPTPEMKCDHPFLFVIRTLSGVPMFIAYITHPKNG